MHELHDHLSQTLSDRISRRQVVTWYDPRREFTAFVAELAGGTVPDECRIDSVVIGNVNTKLCVLQDSFFEVKFTREKERDHIRLFLEAEIKHVGGLKPLPEYLGPRWFPRGYDREVIAAEYGAVSNAS